MTPAEQFQALAVCLCEQVGGASMCFCGVVIGDEVYDFMGIGGDCDDDECGQAWVRITNSFMASSLGEQDIDGNNCGLELNVEFEVGVLRCFPIEERNESVSAATMLAAFNQQMTDMMAMRTAILCCDSIDKRDLILGVYTPVLNGSLFGGTWTGVLGGF